ncbi:MAG: hypothetical protein A2001_14900 [Treponema sp. GWC1_61_84]|nr:MAG: hypothetical protein A2001_14900 [Treponema sp. GWC1_61_84]
MVQLKRPPLMLTATFMRSRGYSERSIREITGLSEKEMLRWYALERLAGTGRRKGGTGGPPADAGEARPVL